jgi:hypothetical protein
VVRTALKSQYHATLSMLRKAIEQCPDDVWESWDYTNPTWRVVYHTLYFVHLYSRRRLEEFTPWEKHQTMLQDLDDVPGPPELDQYCELPHRPPQTGEPLTKAEIMEYWEWCDGMIDDAVDAMDLLSPESGFYWYPISKIEHQIVNIRHIQHHMAQLSERLRVAADIGVEWVGRRR